MVKELVFRDDVLGYYISNPLMYACLEDRLLVERALHSVKMYRKLSDKTKNKQ